MALIRPALLRQADELDIGLEVAAAGPHQPVRRGEGIKVQNHTGQPQARHGRLFDEAQERRRDMRGGEGESSSAPLTVW